MAQVSYTLYGVTITQDAENLKDAIRKAAFFQQIPTVCPKCGAPVVFNTYKAKGTKEETKSKEYEYFGIRCINTPQHSVTFHEYSDTKRGFFYKDSDEWATYNPAANTGASAGPSIEQQAAGLVAKITNPAKGVYEVGAFKIKVWTDQNGQKQRECDCRDFQNNPNAECVHLTALRMKYSKKE